MSKQLPLPLLLLLATWSAPSSAHAQQPLRGDDDPRVTPTVKLVRKCLPAMVSVRVQRATAKMDVVEFGHGGGSVIHESGYILTNNHVVAGTLKAEVAFFQGEWKPAKIVARLPSEDIALLKVDADGPLPVLPWGRSHDLELGEPVITLGSPGGLPHSLSTGIISGLGRSTNTEHAHLRSMVQTTAAISGGSSGGPLINARGELIGIITSRKTDGENLGFAITVDRVQEVMPELIAAEQRFGITHGLTVDTLGQAAKVASVTADSPADKAGLQAGDVLLHAGGKRVRSGVDYYLALVDRAPGEGLPLRIRRGDDKMDVAIELGQAPVPQPATVENLKPGLLLSRYEGNWQRLPDFSQLAAKSEEIKSGPPWIPDDAEVDGFGITLTGFVKVPREGLFTFSTESDDGSRLWLGEQLVVDNDGQHPAREVSGLVRLKQGLYPLRVEYFESGGDQALAITVEDPDGRKQPLPPQWLFHAP